jgi:hypothetical protein
MISQAPSFCYFEQNILVNFLPRTFSHSHGMFRELKMFNAYF